ncbi:ATP-grasp domain-containing protein [Paucibacter soli]|uniref:ATP-grasp domain-containing protein n=1 Tax=Paucibacter soli TaxID=3133433 RepID=UPI0030AA4A4E
MDPIMILPSSILRQPQLPGMAMATEHNAVGQVALMRDIPIHRVEIHQLVEHAGLLRAGALPVGTVEFVREAMRVAGINEPESMSYPVELNVLLGRQLDVMPLDRVRGRKFIKPVTTKIFTGFVWDPSAPDETYSEHDLEQLEVTRGLKPETMVYVAEPVRFLCEWRVYVQGGLILGSARYDQDGEDEAPTPDADLVRRAVDLMSDSKGAPAAYGLDVGVLDTGETVVCEVNDAWALGLYGRAVEARDYVSMLASRWVQIRGA